MHSSIIEGVLIVFGLIIGLLSLLNLIDKDLARDVLTFLSILLPLVYSYRRRADFKKFVGFLVGK
ncbi:MAG: hypothetical protein LZ168_04550 [Thaumarchaeota archaeon]|jgi:hypothetical protein|nr:hypothetical protein [Candidatus Geocrenenecus arthurdayi]